MITFAPDNIVRRPTAMAAAFLLALSAAGIDASRAKVPEAKEAAWRHTRPV